MRIDELNWFDVEQYLKHDDRLMWVLGSCEQHAYLSLLSDVLIPQALADAASQQTDVLVAPSLNFGSSPYFLAYPGTFSLRINTLLDVVEDVIRSAYRHGFRRIMILNGHGGNDPVRSRIYELLNELPGLQVVWYAWWQSHSIEQIAIHHGLKRAHANWLEAFSFTQVATLPNTDKTPPHITGLLSAEATRQAYGDGSFGGFYQVSPEIMNELFSAALQDILQMLKFE